MLAFRAWLGKSMKIWAGLGLVAFLAIFEVSTWRPLLIRHPLPLVWSSIRSLLKGLKQELVPVILVVFIMIMENLKGQGHNLSLGYKCSSNLSLVLMSGLGWAKQVGLKEFLAIQGFWV